MSDVMCARTESGTVYTINWKAQTVTRDPGPAAAMRRDELPVRFVYMAEPVIGEPLEMTLLRVSDDPDVMSTLRRTSPVVDYQPV